MKEVRDIVACVVDRGTFFPVAKRLARIYKRVLYHTPSGESFETLAKACLGDGHHKVELTADFHSQIEDIDLFVFPDCRDGHLQMDLQNRGFAVWGSKLAEEQEQYRGRWIETCRSIGLPMPPTHKIVGISNLGRFLSDHQGELYHVKISRYRGDMETWRTATPEQTQNKLDLLAVKFGPLKERVVFFVQENIETEIEGGSDTYFVAGQWPDKVILGYEKKARSYFATWKNREDMPPEIWKPSDLIAPLLTAYGYCNMVSTEVRVKGSESYLLDPCFRFPSPAGEEQLELYANLAQIMWLGANGEMVEPEMTAKFCGEAIIAYDGDRESWKSVSVPDEVEDWVKLYSCVKFGGAYHFPPAQDPEAIGCAIALGDTPEEVVDGLKDIAEALKDQPVELQITPLADLFKEIELAEDEGIPFSDSSLPEPSSVIADA